MCRIVRGMAILLLFACVLPVMARESRPVLVKKNGEYTIVLPAPMRAALHAFDRHFTIWKQHEYLPDVLQHYHFTARQAPFAVIGDFNGDGKMDVVVQGHNQQSDIIVGVLSHGRGYHAMLVEAIPGPTDPAKEWYDTGEHERQHGLWNYLTYVAPGMLNSPFEDHTVKLTTDAVQANAYEKGAAAYYYRNGQFHSYATED